MSPYFVVKCTTFSFDWKVCCIPPNVGGCIKRTGCDVFETYLKNNNVDVFRETVYIT